MAGSAAANRSGSQFEFELVEADSDQLTTIVVSSDWITSWIEPAKLKLRQRIGKGLFGDVWLATHNHSADSDYEEFQEVAVKMLPPLKEESITVVLNMLSELFSKCEGLESVCKMQGASIICGKLCIVMKFYEGSIGDKMARLNGEKLSMQDVLRYGADLALGIMELHCRGILVLNLKPSNFLLNENDQAVLGDVGIPYLLLGIPLFGLDMIRRLGTPNYMAPEQWQPEVRGPISFETDSWGFACSIVEMLTGMQPWSGKSVDEIHKAVVKRKEKPHIPRGLPPAVENVIVGCFEYDFRSRPLMKDILSVFKSSQNTAPHDGSLVDPGNRTITKKSINNCYSEWFLSKDRLQVGDMVRSRKPPNSCNPESMEVPEGTVVGLEPDGDKNGFVLVRLHGIHDPIRIHESALERVTYGLAAGDWVRLKAESKKHSPVGILHSVDRDGNVAVGVIGIETLWKGSHSGFQMAEAFRVGQFVRLKSDIFSPRFEWPPKRGCEWATGRISQVLPNGCLVVKFPGRFSFDDTSNTYLADPAEVEGVSFKTCSTLVKKYRHVEDFHWAVRPLVMALSLFAAFKLGTAVGKKIGRCRIRGCSSVTPTDVQHRDDQTATARSAGWIPSKVAKIFFGESPSMPASQ